MLARFRHHSLLSRIAVIPMAVSLISFASACDKVPLLAPGGTVITLFPTSNTVPLNGEIEIIATAIENGTTTSTPTTPPANGGTPGGGTPTAPTSTSSTGAGTPVQNGTLITFTTTIGRIEPSEARTTNGQVRVRLIAGGQSGTATVTAFSGGASGKLENLRVGTAAAERVLLTATPQALGPLGGASEISARVEDVSGAGISGVPVAFTTDQGTLSPGTAVTDGSGVAKVTLTTTRDATVTANVAGKTATVTVKLNPRTGLTLAAPTNTITALQPAQFTVNVNAPSTGTIIRDVTIAWGDGSVQSIGAISASTVVTHVYQEDGTFTVVATATDASGFTEQVRTTVLVLAAQPPSVTVTATPGSVTFGQAVRFTAQVQGNTSAITSYVWDFDAGADPRTATTTGNQAIVRYFASLGPAGTKVVSVTVTQANGPQGDGFGTVVVSAGGGTPLKKQ
jgi:hypothetical protein